MVVQSPSRLSDFACTGWWPTPASPATRDQLVSLRALLVENDMLGSAFQVDILIDMIHDEMQSDPPSVWERLTEGEKALVDRLAAQEDGNYAAVIRTVTEE